MDLHVSQYVSLSLLVCLVSCAPAPTTLNESPSTWDFFMFVEQSPGGICYYNDWKDCTYSNIISNWTMHGIWATLNGTTGPNWCNPNATFTLKDIQELLPEMVKQWPNTRPDTSFGSFWSHEWRKHGTCATEIDCMNSEKGFFSTVLDLHHNKMNYTTVLSNHGILPSHNHTFKTDDFNAAFMSSFGVLPLLECLYSEDKGQVLSQISLCLQKDFSIMSCPDYIFKTSSSRCWDTQVVNYIPNF